MSSRSKSKRQFKSLWSKRSPETEYKRYEREAKLWPQGLNGGTTVNGVLLTGVGTLNPSTGLTTNVNPFTVSAASYTSGFSFQQFDDDQPRSGHKMTLVRLDYMITIEPNWLKAGRGATIFWCLVKQNFRGPEWGVGGDNGRYPTFTQVGAGPQFRQLFDIDFDDTKNGRWPLRNPTFKKQYTILKKGKWYGERTLNVVAVANNITDDYTKPLVKSELVVQNPGEHGVVGNTIVKYDYDGVTTDSLGTKLHRIWENPDGVTKWTRGYVTKGSIKERMMMTYFKEADFSDVGQVPNITNTGYQEWTKNNHIYLCCWSRAGDGQESSTFPPQAEDTHKVTIRWRMTCLDD